MLHGCKAQQGGPISSVSALVPSVMHPASTSLGSPTSRPLLRSRPARRPRIDPPFPHLPSACRFLHASLAPSTPAPLCSGDEYGEAYYADLDDWLFDSALELQAVLARLTTPPAIAADGTQLPTDASQPALPVFAVFAGSSKAAGQPANGSVAAVDGQPAGPRVVELLVAPFSEAARTPVPHTETRTGLDPRWAKAASGGEQAARGSASAASGWEQAAVCSVRGMAPGSRGRRDAPLSLPVKLEPLLCSMNIRVPA